ncbi:ATP-binding protein [Aliiroseovarius crassostreae]|uniref:ATP-binding protein n=1 Tax=Aliiroseovarius crassostreae TaxID=154981 RepID=UPI0022002FCD|nr:ATP-binding protein [Aliiroseovarius crassostreae]UWQ07288.1 GAF domain-containing protein [Aliiroseovarius crassostreae]
MTVPFSSEAPLQSASGQAFFDQFVQFAGLQLQAEMVTIGAFRMFEHERVQVCASSFRDNDRALFEYETLGAPCHEVVVSGRALVVLGNVQNLYPRDSFFRRYGFHSYVGMPLRNSVGEIIGLVQASWKRKVGEDDSRSALELLERFSARLGYELEMRGKIATLSALLQDAEADDSNARFPRLAASLQAALALKTVFIAECVDSDPDHFRILGYCLAGVDVPALQGVLVPYEGSPCDGLRHGKKLLIEEGLQQMFPNQPAFAEQGVQAYLGIALHDADGQVIGHVALLNDRCMSERLGESDLLRLLVHRVETELRRHQSDQLRRAAEAAFLIRQKTESLGLMASSLSHDFNNLLASMVGHSELALDVLEPDHPARNSLEVISSCLEASTSLVGRLLDYAKGAGVGQMQPVQFGETIREALRLLPFSATQFDLQLELPEQPLWVQADKTQIAQLLMNLVLNAMEAMTEGEGRITIRVQRRPLTLEERGRMVFEPTRTEGECVLLELSDTGSGMSPEVAAKVFDPYFTTKENGKGLGMAAVLGIARAHGASIMLDTGEGQGTTFRFAFPPAAAPSAGAEKATCVDGAAQGGDARAQKVLVVDDEEVLGAMLRTSLTKAGYAPFVAQGCDGALALMRGKGPFDCALIDITMPGRNGWETYRALADIQPDLKAIMMSGFSISPADAGFPELADFPFVTKPFRPSHLLPVLAEVLKQPDI